MAAPAFVAPRGNSISDETAQLVWESIQRAQMPTDTRGITIGSGFIGYELEAPAKGIVPVITPLVNMLPRRQGTGINIVNWKAITSFDTGHAAGALTNAAVQPPQVAYNVVSMSNIMATIALSNAVDFEAQWYGTSLEGDVRGRRVAELLYALKMLEERWLINASQLLMVPPAPVVSVSSISGGHGLDATSYWFAVTAINAQGETTMSGQTNVITAANAGANTNTFAVTVFTVWNATGYNLYIGSGSTAPARTAMWVQASYSGNTNAPQPGFNANVTLVSGGLANSGEVFGPTVALSVTAAIVTSAVNNPPATNTAKTFVDGSSNIKMYDGILAQALNNTGSGNGPTLQAYVQQPTNTNGTLQLADIDNMLEYLYSNAAGDPDFLVMHPVTHRKVTDLVIAANQTRFVIDATQPANQARLTAQYRVGHYLNTATGKEIPIIPDRYCPVDTIVALPMTIPYPVPEASTAIEIETQREYWGVDFAIVASQYSFADYVNETVKVYFLGGLGVIRGINPDR